MKQDGQGASLPDALGRVSRVVSPSGGRCAAGVGQGGGARVVGQRVLAATVPNEPAVSSSTSGPRIRDHRVLSSGSPLTVRAAGRGHGQREQRKGEHREVTEGPAGTYG
jgi:hypothetical protein